jgi:hypothetical protein
MDDENPWIGTRCRMVDFLGIRLGIVTPGVWEFEREDTFGPKASPAAPAA